MPLTLDKLLGGLGLVWETIRDTVASPETRERLRRRHLDSKYGKNLDPVNEATGLMSLSRDRLTVSIEYLITLADVMQEYRGRRVIDVNLSDEQRRLLRQIPKEFNEDDQARIDLIEATADHDLAATTDYLKMQLLTDERYGLQDYADAVHFALTSENINGPAFALANKRVLETILIPTLIEFQEELIKRGEAYLEMPIAAFTHGQAAEYTTLGKEHLNLADTIDRTLRKLMIDDLLPFRFTASMRGAVGNINDHKAAYPSIDWRTHLDEILIGLDIEPVDMSDQCDSFLRYQEFAHVLDELATTVEKAGEDFWMRVHDQVYDKKTKKGHKGSSAMPQKKDPWLVEGGLAILGKGIAQLLYTTKTLRQYHNQGDMSRSILTRDIGDDYGKIVLGLRRILTELRNYVPNQRNIEMHLAQNPDMISGPVMTTLKAMGIEGDMYREVQALSFNTDGTRKNAEEYRVGLAGVCDKYTLAPEDKARILHLAENPKNCLGDAIPMGQEALVRCKKTLENLKSAYNL